MLPTIPICGAQMAEPHHNNIFCCKLLYGVERTLFDTTYSPDRVHVMYVYIRHKPASRKRCKQQQFHTHIPVCYAQVRRSTTRASHWRWLTSEGAAVVCTDFRTPHTTQKKQVKIHSQPTTDHTHPPPPPHLRILKARRAHL